MSNEMAILILILSWWYFSCLQIYSEKLFNERRRLSIVSSFQHFLHNIKYYYKYL